MFLSWKNIFCPWNILLKNTERIQSLVIEDDSKREKNVWAKEARTKKENEIVHNQWSLLKLFYLENKQQEWSEKRWVVYVLYCLQQILIDRKVYKFLICLRNKWRSILFQRSAIIWITLYSHLQYMWPNSTDTTRIEIVYPLIICAYLVMRLQITFSFSPLSSFFLFYLTFNQRKIKHYRRRVLGSEPNVFQSPFTAWSTLKMITETYQKVWITSKAKYP